MQHAQIHSWTTALDLIIPTCRADQDLDPGNGKANEVDTLDAHDLGLETGTIGTSEAEAGTGEFSITSDVSNVPWPD